mmetsp:Transcript_50425/g.155953  ORF Transcript_50425/g.155953 Transcript_50425/m.155953 type:complete len:350 (+) Transcript_50425:274-1323(+)
MLLPGDPWAPRPVVRVEACDAATAHLGGEERGPAEDLHALGHPDVQLLGAIAADGDPAHARDDDVVPRAVAAAKDLHAVPHERPQLLPVLAAVRRVEKLAGLALQKLLRARRPADVQRHVEAEEGGQEADVAGDLVDAHQGAGQEGPAGVQHVGDRVQLLPRHQGEEVDPLVEARGDLGLRGDAWRVHEPEALRQAEGDKVQRGAGHRRARDAAHRALVVHGSLVLVADVPEETVDEGRLPGVCAAQDVYPFGVHGVQVVAQALLKLLEAVARLRAHEDHVAGGRVAYLPRHAPDPDLHALQARAARVLGQAVHLVHGKEHREPPVPARVEELRHQRALEVQDVNHHDD